MYWPGQSWIVFDRLEVFLLILFLAEELLQIAQTLSSCAKHCSAFVPLTVSDKLKNDHDARHHGQSNKSIESSINENPGHSDKCLSLPYSPIF
jgi:hypothetical protein